jgi:hypothetical protein
VFEFVHNSTKVGVRFHFGCIFPHELLYHVNHMVVQMMSIPVDVVLLVPNKSKRKFTRFETGLMFDHVKNAFAFQ